MLQIPRIKKQFMLKKSLNLIRLWIVFISLMLGCLTVSLAHAAPTQTLDSSAFSKPQVDVGVLAIRGHLYAEQRWQPTIYWLNQQIPEVRFVLHPLDLDGMTKAVENQSMDFILRSDTLRPAGGSRSARNRPTLSGSRARPNRLSEWHWV